MIFEKRISVVIDEIEKGNTTKQASKKASIKIDDIYKWLEEGLNGNKDYEKFAEVYKEYLKPIQKAYITGIKKRN